MEVGFVTKIDDFLIHIDGMPTIKIDDVVESESGVRGWVTAISKEEVQALLLDDVNIKPGELFKRSRNPITINVGSFLLGRTINPLGVAIDGKGLLAKTKTDLFLELDRPALGIKSRNFITNQLETGIALVDTLMPLAKGQRELVLGDARSGKTSFLIDMIVNQKRNNVICIYASIGKPISETRSLIDTLAANGALPYTVILAAPASDPAPMIYLAPLAAFTIAEYFQQQGKDVLLILDDLGNHAKISREISLLQDKIPTRESYPADIFYQHSHLLERAGNFNKTAGGGSITALPVMEVNLDDLTSYIPTNLMSMTDGHLLFKANLFNQGQRPGIDIFLSVSRVGAQTQAEIQKLLASRVKTVLTQATQLGNLASFSGELSTESQIITKQAKFIQELISQDDLTFIPKDIQLVLLSLVFTSFIKTREVESLKQQKSKIIQAFLSKLNPQAKFVLAAKTEVELFQKLESLVPEIEKVVAAK